MNYDVNYFIDKFESISEAKWTVNIQINKLGQRCALGHCMITENPKLFGHETPEGLALTNLGYLIANNKGDPIASIINDGDVAQYNQPSPKQRILAALYDIKANQHVDAAKEIINTPEFHSLPAFEVG